MKNSVQNLILFSMALAISGCGPIDKVKKNEATTTESTIISADANVVTKTVEGLVVNIQQGKDGYTAELKTQENEVYFVTISHSNLTYHENFKTVKIGENLKVTGDFWMMEKENHVTVRQIH